MNDNYGDFLLYYVVEKIVEKYENDFIWYSADVDDSYNRYCKVNEKTKKEAIRNADLVIFAGGGYFGEPAKRKIYWNLRCLIKHIIPAYMVSRKKIPYIIVGVEVGPISLSLNRILLRKIFRNAEKISVRNEESEVFLKKLNLKNAIEVNPDWIMGFKKDDFPIKKIDVDSLLKKTKQEKIVFLHLTTKNDNNGMNNIVVDLKKYQKDNNNIVYVIGCDQNRDTQKERAKILFKNLNNQKNRLCFYKGPWYLTKTLSKVDAVVTDKLHVGIVSTKFKKEVISVASHPKSIRFYKLIGRNEWASLISDIKPNEVYRKLTQLKFEPIILNDTLFDKAKRNEVLVEEFLDKYSKQSVGEE